MKKVVCVLALLSVSSVAFADSLNVKIGGGDVLRISAGPQYSDKATIRDLEERIYRLERAVAQMQNEVFRLSDMPRAQASKVSCYLETTFDGTITGSGSTKTEAKGKILKECHDKGTNSIFCKDRDIKCDDGV